jgi:type VI secretion system protein ImpL
MLSFAKRRWFVALLGLLLLALFIWIAGPYFAFAGYAPLESILARVILIAVIVALWAASGLRARLRAARASDQLAAAVLRQAPPEPRPSEEATQLREKFEDAVATLKQARRRGRSLYDLPWYVIIGAPGSGKTTALLNAGLKFPLEQRGRMEPLRGVGGTRNCHWWFTDAAVFLDTAGRYFTQDSDAESDAAGWKEFLALLRKYRKRRPLNGVILTISVQDLMGHDERERARHVDAARRRLNELNRELRILLPVYVIVTKCDLVAGFTEYFDDLAQAGRAQVWGVTFPYAQTLSGDAMSAFPSEFDQLMARLNVRGYSRLEEERNVRRRAKIFGFPQQMIALRDLLEQFVGEVVASTRLDRQILLRGIYFTSGTQEGTPVDRLLVAIGRGYGVAPAAIVPPTGRGKAYFMERLLKDVLIGESGLAGVDRRFEVKKAAIQLGAYTAVGLVVVAGLVLMSVSYNRNLTYITEAASELAKLDRVPSVAASAPVDALLPRLNALRAIVDSANRYGDDIPWSMRWGLYQGRSLGNAARDAYERELDGTLLPRVAARIEKRLPELAPEPEKLYEYLKAYLMLGEPRFIAKPHLQFVADLEWNPSERADPDAVTSLSGHFKRLLDSRNTLRPMAVNPSLLAQARTTICHASIPHVVYSRLKRNYKEDSARAVRLDLAAGLGADQVLRRKSGRSLAEPIPSFFSRPVFVEVIGRQASEIVKEFDADDWVWGEGQSCKRGEARLAADVHEVYERDYIATWERVLDDLELVPLSTAAHMADVLGILAGQGSPLRGLLAAVTDNTALVQPPSDAKASGGSAEAAAAGAAAQKSVTDRLGGRAVTEQLGRLFESRSSKGPKAATLPGGLVTAHFQPIHRLMAGEPGNAPIDRILLRIGQVEHHLRSIPPENRRLATLTSPAMREVLRDLQREAETLPPVIQRLVEQIGGEAEATVVAGAAGELERRYRDEVLRECERLLPGRYPFTPDGTSDLPLGDFARLLGYDGVFDRFFRENLEPLVDRSQSPWTWRSGEAHGSRAILDHFEQAKDIRELFFRKGSGALEVKFHLTLVEADMGALRFLLEVDGQGFDYRIPVRSAIGVWPGPNPGTAAATWYEHTGQQRRLAFFGPWAWFRLIDAAQERRESDVRSWLAYKHGEHNGRVMLEATSVQNPFSNRNWQRFRCDF